MAFDGVTIACVISELKKELIGGRLYKIAQPENDELLLTIKQPTGQKRLLLSASASLPLIYLTESNKPSPMTAPNFCMLLRKHLQNGRIVNISQPGLERIVHIDIEHLDEMGDLRHKTLVMELMGKHSNLIFCNDDNTIIDSIKRVSAAVSSVREVLPGKPYFIAHTQDKLDALTCDETTFRETLAAKPQSVFKAIYGSFTGISPVLAQELCHEAGIVQYSDPVQRECIGNGYGSGMDSIQQDRQPVLDDRQCLWHIDHYLCGTELWCGENGSCTQGSPYLYGDYSRGNRTVVRDPL